MIMKPIIIHNHVHESDVPFRHKTTSTILTDTDNISYWNHDSLSTNFHSLLIHVGHSPPSPHPLTCTCSPHHMHTSPNLPFPHLPHTLPTSLPLTLLSFQWWCGHTEQRHGTMDRCRWRKLSLDPVLVAHRDQPEKGREKEGGSRE